MRISRFMSYALPALISLSAYADVKFWQLSGIAPVQSVTSRRGNVTTFSYPSTSVYSWSKGGVVWHQNKAATGNTFCGMTALFPQPFTIGGETVSITNNSHAIGNCIWPGSYTVDWIWPNYDWQQQSVHGYPTNTWSFSLTIPDSLSIGLNRVNVPAKACYGASVYSTNPHVVIENWKGECNNYAAATITLPLDITIINLCRTSISGIDIDHGTLSKGINAEGNIASRSLNITCDGPTDISMSFQGVTSIEGVANSVSLNDGWYSQLGVDIDGIISNDKSVAVNVSNSKSIKITSVLHGTAGALPGAKVSSGVALIMNYN